MRLYLFFVVKFFGEENAQCFFISCLAEAVADEEAQQGKTDAKHNLRCRSSTLILKTIARQ